MQDSQRGRHPRGYSLSHATRLQEQQHRPVPAQQQKKKKQTINGGGISRKAASSSSSSGSRKSLLDAFKQHGMKLCDGTKLNAVGKAIQCIGSIPPTMSAHITALFLSQNNLRVLDGVEQFASLRLLSIGGNLITTFKEIERLAKLPRLRNLNVLGNPVCDHPNYRFRVVECLKQLQVLDTSDITGSERESANFIASQDKALRSMVMGNHFDIQKLQKIAQLIRLHKDFYGFVMGNTTSTHFDRVPDPQGAQVDVVVLMRLWKYKQSLSTSELEALEMQMVTIVIRTHGKLADHPKLKAKEYLLNLASGKPSLRVDARVSVGMRNRYASWEEAYGNVIALQQQTMANLQGLCERHNKEMTAFLKRLLTVDPQSRRQFTNVKWTPRGAVSTSRVSATSPDVPLVGDTEYPNGIDKRSLRLSGSTYSAFGRSKLPPQQQDPERMMDGHADSSDDDSTARRIRAVQPPRSSLQSENACDDGDTSIKPPIHERNKNVHIEEKRNRQAAKCSKFSEMRSGEFGKKTLSEAIHGFKLRVSSSPVVPAPPPPPKQRAPLALGRLQEAQVYTSQRRDDTTFPHSVQSPKDHTQVEIDRNPKKSASHRVTKEFTEDLPMKGIRSGFERALMMTQRNFDTRRVSAIDSVETSSSVSGISEESSFWQSSRLRDRNSGHQDDSARLNRVEELPRRVSPDDNYYPVTGDDPCESTQQDSRQHNNRERSQVTTLPHHPLGERQHELEEREEKYIKALIRSEQRELDLRNQVNGFRRRLSQYQQTMAQELGERQQIKEEVNERVQAVAAPKILKRFFVRWIHHYHWSLQVGHLHKKRCFVLQHNLFWQWRRKLWVQQHLRTIRGKKQRQLVRRHFTEWVNLSRLTVITAHSREMRDRTSVGRLFSAWKRHASKICVSKHAQRARQQESMQKLQRSCFNEWVKISRHKRHLKSMVTLHWRQSQRMRKQITFCKWMMFVIAYARPVGEKVAHFSGKIRWRYQKKSFVSWRNVVRGKKLYDLHIQRRVWKHWVNRLRHERSEKEHALRNRRMLLKDRFHDWHVVAQDQITFRRSLSLAKRYLNQRRLRKLWLYWKCYTFAKRKYIQGSTKALKHYFIKLMRNSWRLWKWKTRKNLLSVKEKKHGELRRHFEAFREGIRLSISERYRMKLLLHLKKRQERTKTHQWMLQWKDCVRRRRRCKQHYQVVARQSKLHLLASAWHQWISGCLAITRQRLQVMAQNVDGATREKHDMEADILIANDRAISLTQQIATLKASMKEQESELTAYQDNVLRSEELNATLEAEIKSLEESRVQERQEWKAFRDQADDQEGEKEQQIRVVTEDNTKLHKKIQELQSQIVEEKQRTTDVNRKFENAREELKNAKQDHVSELSQLNEASKEVERHIEELKEQLEDEQRQKEETANRLQEYEKRIVSTCQDINQHEEAHRRENERLRAEQMRMEAKVSEEQVRNAELQRLLREKNAIIHQLTQKITDVRERTDRRDTTGDGQQLRGNSGLSSRSHGKEIGDQDGRDVSLVAAHESGTTIGSLLKDINHSILTRTELMDARSRSTRPLCAMPSGSAECGMEYCEQSDPAASRRGYTRQISVAPSTGEEHTIDEHTNKIHEDIRVLQERIARRLNRAPAAPVTYATGNHRAEAHRSRIKSLCSSYTSLSEEESESTEPETSVNPSKQSGTEPRLEEDSKSSSKRTSRTGKARISSASVSSCKPSSVAKSHENIAKAANTLDRARSLKSSGQAHPPLHASTGASKKQVLKRVGASQSSNVRPRLGTK